MKKFCPTCKLPSDGRCPKCEADQEALFTYLVYGMSDEQANATMDELMDEAEDCFFTIYQKDNQQLTLFRPIYETFASYVVRNERVKYRSGSEIFLIPVRVSSNVKRYPSGNFFYEPEDVAPFWDFIKATRKTSIDLVHDIIQRFGA
jgi:hypothetical protein